MGAVLDLRSKESLLSEGLSFVSLDAFYKINQCTKAGSLSFIQAFFESLTSGQNKFLFVFVFVVSFFKLLKNNQGNSYSESTSLRCW